METKTLEQKAIQTGETEKVKTNCHNCGEPLDVSKSYFSEPNREYTGVYISPDKIPYCSRNCHWIFTDS